MKKKRTSQFKQGIFKPKHPEKYKGTLPILYRSSFELKFMRWCDSNPAVLNWGSESIIIPYANPLTGRVSRYFVDNNITLKDKHGNINKYLIEIKPLIQTQPPKPTRNTKSLLRRQAEYVKNRAKWESATQWAKKKGHQFVILTERELGISK
jgi:hypothetical protein